MPSPPLVRGLSPLLIVALRVIASSEGARADYFDDMGYTQLKAMLGVATPDGTGIPVLQAEGFVSRG